MIKLERFEVMNFENAMRGARNPLNSWARMDSKTENGVFTFGPNDLDLAKRLCKAGSDHRKFIRQIFVTVDITAPIYWWKEYDTYKVGTVANSTSTMHNTCNPRFVPMRSMPLTGESTTQHWRYGKGDFQSITTSIRYHWKSFVISRTGMRGIKVRHLLSR